MLPNLEQAACHLWVRGTWARFLLSVGFSALLNHGKRYRCLLEIHLVFRKPFHLRQGFDLLVCVTPLSLQLFRKHSGFHICDHLGCLSCCCRGESMEAAVQEPWGLLCDPWLEGNLQGSLFLPSRESTAAPAQPPSLGGKGAATSQGLIQSIDLRESE